MFRILVVEDDKNTRKLLCEILSQGGFAPLAAADGVEALELMERQQVDLLVLDVMMPRMGGYELARQIRLSWETLPLLMLTAKGEPADKRQGFLMGTDDYMTKPFDEEELLLRIKALLRRAKIASDRKLRIGAVVLDYDALTVTREGGEPITLPQKEFHLLFKLLSYPGTIFTRLQLMDEIWGMDTETDDHTISVHVSRLRERFGHWPEFDILTVRGLGYKGVKQVETETV